MQSAWSSTGATLLPRTAGAAAAAVGGGGEGESEERGFNSEQEGEVWRILTYFRDLKSQTDAPVVRSACPMAEGRTGRG